MFTECESVRDIFDTCKQILRELLQKDISNEEFIYFSFNHRKKSRLMCALWFAVKVLYRIYNDKNRNKTQLLRDIVKEVEWNLNLNRKVGSWVEFRNIKTCVDGYI